MREAPSLPLRLEAILKAGHSTFWLFCKLHSSSYQALTLEIFPLLLFPSPKHLCEGVTSGYRGAYLGFPEFQRGTSTVSVCSEFTCLC